MQFNVVRNDIARLLRLFEGNAKKYVWAGLLNCASVISEKTRDNAPVLTGMLKASVEMVIVSQDRLAVEVRVTALNEQGKPYDIFQEYGWTTKSGMHVDGKFYFHRAIAETKEECNAIMTEAIRKAIAESTGKSAMGDLL